MLSHILIHTWFVYNIMKIMLNDENWIYFFKWVYVMKSIK